ncbi:YEATS domain-containing protein 4 isoform X1 [Hippoglossus stenolepis]|uniref:YEATS domain-containing protein 4 isoform X1 n=2 Tax=Hippoglossus TaxID=8266 RepID=UPI001FAFBF8C|nr:YEATS domain-containing protein 4 isoform X1 [Hippoglossus stenolepis]
MTQMILFIKNQHIYSSSASLSGTLSVPHPYRTTKSVTLLTSGACWTVSSNQDCGFWCLNGRTIKSGVTLFVQKNSLEGSPGFRSLLCTMFKKMSEFGPDSGGRVKGVTIVKPIVFGNVARYFGKKREEDGHTHQWSVYVKPYRNEDMSAYVKKIQFKLHESYGNPLRVVTKPPYEITETGWGEFEIIIKIFFIDPNERAVTLYHLLKLFQSDSSAMPKKTVVSEFYDEMIFQDPTAMMQQLLTTSRQLTLGAYKHETEFSELEQKTKEKMDTAKKRTSQEIAELKDKLKASRENINHLKAEIRKLEEDGDHKDH